MIPRSVVKKFLNRDLDDHRWLKRLTHKEVNKLLASLDPPPKYHPKLGLHQKVGLYLGIKYKCFAYWYDMGTGKTLMSLELLQYWWETGQLRRALVFVISDKAFSTWERQIKQYKINVPVCALDSTTSAGKWKTLSQFEDGIILLHYPGTVAMVSGRPTSKKAKSRKRKKKTVLIRPRVDRLLRDVDAVVFDEITKAATFSSLTHQVCNRVANQAEFRYGLAGMPFGRDPTPVWGQMRLIDHGDTLGPTLGLFRAAFFNEEENEYSNSPYAMNYTFKKKMKPVLSEMLQHNSLTYTADECIDLPPERPIIEEVRLPIETRAYYNELVEELKDAKGLVAIKSIFHRLRQLSSGFLGLKDDETGERASIDFAENPKLDRLIDLLDTFPENRKALIYYQYTYSGKKIVQRVKEEFGIKLPWLWSGTKDARGDIERFIDDPSIPWILIQNQLGAYSLDGLQVANYEFFYESPVSAVEREQAKRRIRRQGQKHRTTFFYDLVVKGTVDEKILKFNAEGVDLFQSLLVNPSRVIR